MPVTAIPFKAPAPFDIPPHMAAPIRQSAPEAAGEQALALLQQVDAGDAMAIAWADEAGGLSGGPFFAADGGAHAALGAMAAGQLGAFLHPAVADAKPLLYMGEVTDADGGPFPPALHTWLLGGQAVANVGFLYVYPLLDPAGKARGALMIHRSLAAGPLNHDQPAIAHALAHLLGESAAAA